MSSSRIGDQLEFFPEWVEGIEYAQAAPWGGRSPRELTAAYKRFILKAQAAKSVRDFVTDPGQYDLWLPAQKAPRIYRGAPLLDELRRSR